MTTGTAARMVMREATRDAHERLHGIPALHRLAAGTITREDYVALLRRFLAFHETAERCLAEGPSLCALGIVLEDRNRSRQIRADLEALGDETPAAQGAMTLRVPPSIPAALGYLYVIEGATLGGRILARALDPLLGAGEGPGRSFLLGYGTLHAAMWRAVCDAIDVCGADEESRHAMTTAALDAFACFETLVAVKD